MESLRSSLSGQSSMSKTSTDILEKAAAFRFFSCSILIATVTSASLFYSSLSIQVKLMRLVPHTSHIKLAYA